MTCHEVEEIRVSPNGGVLVVKFVNIKEWHRVTVSDGTIISGPADPITLATWPIALSNDPRKVRPSGLEFSADRPDPRSYTFTPTAEPQLVFFEGGNMSHVDHGDEGPQPHMSDRSLYMLDALLRLASRRVTGEIMKREGKE